MGIIKYEEIKKILAEGRIKKCPCCTSEATLENFVTGAMVKCKKCDLRVVRKHEAKDDTGVAEVIDAWNRRSND